MSPVQADPNLELAKEALQAFDDLNGLQPGFRPVHAKGILISGKFTPSAEAKSVTRAPHIQRDETPVTVRFSDFAGIPAIPDNDPNASPRGIAIRFHLAEHVHTDIIGHSVDGFPARTPEEFVELLHALHQSGPNAARPAPIEKFLGSHPAALAFVKAPKPMPLSFVKEVFFPVTAYRFTNGGGVSRYGRYRIEPEDRAEYPDAATEQKAAPNFLFDEIGQRLAKGPAKMRIVLKLAGKEDRVDDSTVHWPPVRPEIDFGVIELQSIAPNNAEEQRHIIFDPIPRVDGIEPSEDPLLDFRATLYLMSGRRRRAANPQKV